jgi:hypothetical protein
MNNYELRITNYESGRLLPVSLPTPDSQVHTLSFQQGYE